MRNKKESYQEGLARLQSAAELGHTEEQFVIGYMYSERIAVAKDNVKSIPYHTRCREESSYWLVFIGLLVR